MQAAQTFHPLCAGAQHQMVGVAEDDVGPCPFDLIHIERLHRAGGADRHEGGRGDVAARGFQAPGARLALAGGDFKGKLGHGAGV